MNDVSANRTRFAFKRDFIQGCLGLFFFVVGMHALTPTLPIYLSRLHNSEKEIGILIGVFSVSSLVFRFVVGRALQKYTEKSIILTGSLVSAFTYVLCLFLRPFWPFFFIRALQGISLACIDTAAIASIANTIPPAFRTRAFGYLLLAPSLALAVAAPVGMHIINNYGFPALFLSCMIFAIISISLSWTTKGHVARSADNDRASAPKQTGTFFDVKVTIPAITSFLQLFIWGAVTAFFPLYAIQCGVANPGLFFTAMAVMMVAGRIFGGRIMDTTNKERLITIILSCIIVILFTLAFSKTLPMFLLVGSLWGIGAAFFVPVSMAYALEIAGSSDGAAVGTFRAISDMGLGLGPVVAGLILPFTGYRTMFLSLALLSVTNLVHFHFYVKK